MHTLRRRISVAGAGLAAAAIAAFTAAPAASAAPTGYHVTTDPVQAAAGWLTTQFTDKTHLPSPAGDHFDQKLGHAHYPLYGENADVMFGLAAAKAGRNKIDTALRYLAANADVYGDIRNSDHYGPYDGSIAKMALAAIVAGVDPTHFGGYDLMQHLKDDECTASSPSCPAAGAAKNIYFSGSESFVVLAEARVGGASVPSAAALRYLTSLRCANGGFTKLTSACVKDAADLDATSYAIMALTAAGKNPTQLARAVKWLKSRQQRGGYWIALGAPNANTTGLAAAALQGTHLRGTGAPVNSARRWLRSQQVAAGQRGAGAIKSTGSLASTTTSQPSPSVLATAQALTGLVDGGGLATLTSDGTAQSVPLFAPSAALSTSTVRAGRVQTARGNGFVAGERVRVTMHSAPVTLGTVTADPLGSAALRYTVPAHVGAGVHTVTLTGLTSGLTARRIATVISTARVTSAPRVRTSVAAVPVPAPAPGPGLPTVAATGQNSRRLASISGIGFAAVLMGAVLLVLGRRRAH